jgi:hypothetical protein
MSKVKITGNASGTGTLTIAAPNTNTDRTLTLPDGAGEILTDASTLSSSKLSGALPALDGSALTGVGTPPVIFSVYAHNTDQVLTNDTWTKVQLPSKVVDSNNTFDTSTYRWTPDVAGWYSISASIIFSATCRRVYTSIVKNGSYYLNRYISMTGDYLTAGSNELASNLVYMNGSTDYIELYGLLYINSGGSGTISHDANIWGRTHMTGILVSAD